MSNILITGGTGYIGSHIALELLKNNFNVFIIDNLSNSFETVINAIEKISEKRVTFINGDLRNYLLLDSFFKDHKIDCVVHCAGLKAVSESLFKPYEYFSNNIVSSLNLIHVMSKYKVKKLIFSSSAVVYDEKETMPLTEMSKIGVGQNPYARTKIMIEQMFKDIYDADQQWSIFILRYFNPVGNDSSCLIGEDPLGIPNNLMPLINQAAFNLNNLTIYGKNYFTKDGTAIRDFIHVSDLASGHVKSIEKILEGKSNYNIYNLGLGKGFSVLEVINTYQEVNKFKINFKFGDRRKGDLEKSYTDNNLAKNALQWIPVYNLQDMCNHSYGWMKYKLQTLKGNS